MRAPSELVESLLNRDLETAKRLLSQGADINCKYGEAGWTALHYTAENQITESARWLLENGADPNAKDIFGQTPLYFSIDSEADCARQEFVEKGSSRPSIEMTSVLLRFGCDPNIETNKGETALALAKSVKHDDAVEMLRQYGAREA